MLPLPDTTQKAFDKLKDCICSDPVLRSPNFSKKFILQTDASGNGIKPIRPKMTGFVSL
jgi:hypothetical protein